MCIFLPKCLFNLTDTPVFHIILSSQKKKKLLSSLIRNPRLTSFMSGFGPLQTNISISTLPIPLSPVSFLCLLLSPCSTSPN